MFTVKGYLCQSFPSGCLFLCGKAEPRVAATFLRSIHLPSPSSSPNFSLHPVAMVMVQTQNKMDT